jgi:hypothetical protein
MACSASESHLHLMGILAVAMAYLLFPPVSTYLPMAIALQHRDHQLRTKKKQSDDSFAQSYLLSIPDTWTHMNRKGRTGGRCTTDEGQSTHNKSTPKHRPALPSISLAVAGISQYSQAPAKPTLFLSTRRQIWKSPAVCQAMLRRW